MQLHDYGTHDLAACHQCIASGVPYASAIYGTAKGSPLQRGSP